MVNNFFALLALLIAWTDTSFAYHGHSALVRAPLHGSPSTARSAFSAVSRLSTRFAHSVPLFNQFGIGLLTPFPLFIICKRQCRPKTAHVLRNLCEKSGILCVKELFIVTSKPFLSLVIEARGYTATMHVRRGLVHVRMRTCIFPIASLRLKCLFEEHFFVLFVGILQTLRLDANYRPIYPDLKRVCLDVFQCTDNRLN